jgi:HAD superfamily hydrolase (TIGR01509 family)
MILGGKIKSVIFDFDGVLVDSEFIANRTAVELKGEYGVHTTLAEQVQRVAGLAQSHPDFQADIKGLPPEYMIEFKKRVRQAFTAELKPLGNAIQLLEQIDLPVCIASGSEPESLSWKLDHTGLRKYFGQNAFSTRQVQRGKPAPDLFLFAATQMGWTPASTLVIEDSVHGVRAGIAAGMTVVGFTGGSHCPPDHDAALEAAGAHYIVNDLLSVLDL